MVCLNVNALKVDRSFVEQAKPHPEFRRSISPCESVRASLLHAEVTISRIGLKPIIGGLCGWQRHISVSRPMIFSTGGLTKRTKLRKTACLLCSSRTVTINKRKAIGISGALEGTLEHGSQHGVLLVHYGLPRCQKLLTPVTHGNATEEGSSVESIQSKRRINNS